MLKLSIQDFEGRTTYVPLKDGEYSIGRDQANQICLPDRNVSRQHARVRARGGQVLVENVAATYGTRFNNLLLRETIEMQPGDVVEIGDYKLELVNEEKRDTAVRDTALPDPASAATRPSTAAPTKGKAADGATAIVNLADISSLLNKEPSSPGSAIAEASQPRLVVESENLRGLELRITKTPIVIGRVAESADLVIDHRSISKEHVRLTRMSDGNWQVLDLGSSNGIKVNGEPYSKSELRSGDRLELGHVTLRFLAAGARAPAGQDGSVAKPNKTLIVGGAVVVGVIAVAVGAFMALGKRDDGQPANSAAGATAELAGTATTAAKTPPGASGEGPSADREQAQQPAVAGAEPEPAAAADAVDSDLAKAQQRIDEGKYEEAVPLLEAAKLRNSGNAVIAAKFAEAKRLADLKERLKKAEASLDSDPKGALEAATAVRQDIKRDAPKAEPLKNGADSIVEEAKRRLSGQAPAKAQGKDADKAAAATAPTADKGKPAEPAKPEPTKPEPTKPEVAKAEAAKADAAKAEAAKADAPAGGPKTGKELYDEAREAMGASDWDRAMGLARQALKGGYKKAYIVLAKASWGKGDKAGCAKYAQAAANAGFESSVQSLLQQCQ